MTPFTVGDYLAERLSQIGVSHHFIVPGDYNLILLDKLEAHPALTEVSCTNELNCSLAAEGYARANGVGVCVVTFSVDAFSTFNGVGSVYADLNCVMSQHPANTMLTKRVSRKVQVGRKSDWNEPYKRSIVTENDSREWVTILESGSANGRRITPAVVFT